jgi:DNA-binding LacI/PurR family transcriptional regulator
MARRWSIPVLVAALLAGLVPSGATAQSGTVVIPDRGNVIEGGRGFAEELQLTDEEAERAFSATSGLTIGVVTPGPAARPADVDVAEIVDALRSTVERRGARVQTCDAGEDSSGAASCVEGFIAANAVAVVLIGGYGDLVDATAQALRTERTIVVSIGDTRVAPLSVVIDSDPITRAFEQGRAGGAPRGVPRSRRRGSAIVASAVETGQMDPGSDAVILGLTETAPKVRVVSRLGPPAIETTADLQEAVAQLPRQGILIGEGVRLTQATAAGLDALPADLQVVAIACTPELMSIIDLGSRVRSCIARANDGAGEAAGNAILAVLIGRDVPAFVDAPLYAYRGIVAVGPGRVQLGRRLSGSSLVVTDAEQATGAARLAGRTVGLIGPSGPGRGEPESVKEARETIEAALAGWGATVSRCAYGTSKSRADRCLDELVRAGAAAIIVLGGSVDLVAPTTAAIAAGVPVLGMDAVYLGDTGAVYVDVDGRSVGRLQGRMAASWASRTWPAETAYAAILNDRGPQGRDAMADAIERSSSLTDPNVLVVGRWASSDTSARTAVSGALRSYPALRLLLGPHAVRGAADLKSVRKPRPPRDLAAFGLACTRQTRSAIDAGGRLKGCVEVDQVRAGTLLVDALARLFAGGTLPGLIDVPLSPYPSDALAPPAAETPAS